mmetsp:Transcript_18747/g.39015  ORF Transcript_18747/g.39015 Transcript_18747/m.39015 type:complete len:436 (-) Transcript_18747:39-1346(-)
MYSLLLITLSLVVVVNDALKLPAARYHHRSSTLNSRKTPTQMLVDGAQPPLLSIALTLLLINSSPPPAFASVAPLADVGLREFLVKDSSQLLRLSLPSSMTKDAPINLEVDPGRQAQEAIELVRLRLEQVGFSGKKPVWIACLKEVNEANKIANSDTLLKSVVSKKELSKANALLEELKTDIDNLRDAVRNEDIKSTISSQAKAADTLYELRLLSMKPGLPFDLSSDAAGMPVLKGRAVVNAVVKHGNGGKEFTLDDGSKSDTLELTMVIDGYRAPVTGGNFVDLVNKKHYDGMVINSVDDLFVNAGSTNGYSENGKVRTIPLEIFYKKDTSPTYHYTSDDDLRATEGFANPFQSVGALGMVHDPEDNDTGSDQFFFLKWDQGLVAPGRNTLDGSSAEFGYVVKNQDALTQIKKGDVIVKMTVAKGGDKLTIGGK